MALMLTRSAQAKVREDGWQTFSAVAPPHLHLQAVTCEAAGCPKLANGWDVAVDETLRAGQLAADYIRRRTQRRGWTEQATPAGPTLFTFPAGVPCFQDRRSPAAQQIFGVGPHRRRRVGAPSLYVVAAGRSEAVQQQINQRGRPAEVTRTHTRGADWVEHLAESWNKMANAANK